MTQFRSTNDTLINLDRHLRRGLARVETASATNPSVSVASQGDSRLWLVMHAACAGTFEATCGGTF